MVILISKKIKRKFQEMLQMYTETLNFGHIECPHCHSAEYILWGTYERGVTYFKDGKLVSEVITIQRIRCKSCKKTHALLPFGIVPYKQLTDEVLIDILSNKEENNYFSEDTVRTIKKQFKEYCYSYLSTILQTTSISKILDLLKTEKDKILTRFIEETNRVFMQIKLGCLGSCPL